MASGLTWQQLQDLKLSELTDAADGWAALSRRADAARERVDGDMSGKLAKTQESESAKSAVKRLKRLGENYHYIQTEGGLIRGSVDGLATELAAPQKRLSEALSDAAAYCYTVHADGSITYPPGGENEVTGDQVAGGTVAGNNGMLGSGGGPKYTPGMGPDAPELKSPNPHRAKAQDIADRVAHSVREAREIDDRYSRTLQKLKAARGLDVDAATWANVASDVDAVSDVAGKQLPLDKTPAERKEWWDHLSKEQREEYIAAFPELIGNMDGIPALVRDEANRENLQVLIGKMDGRDDEKSKTMLAGLTKIQSQLEHPDPKYPKPYLLGIGDQGNGRAIVSYGNPDAAANVSAYVPGLGTALDESFATGDLRRAADTANDAQNYNPSSASIVWLGYDAPQSADVMTADDAKAGAPAYNQFMAGISATNEHSDPHVTAVGHSYGSYTVGQAAQMDGGIPGADDIVLVGSPGTGADKAADLNVGKDHVFVGAADNDPVTKLPSHQQAHGMLDGALREGTRGGYAAGPPGSPGGFIGSVVGGVTGGATGFIVGGMAGDPDLRWFGTDPASQDFGAHRFLVDDGPPAFKDPHDPAPAHSNYFSPEKDKESANNIARIVAGVPEEISTERPR
ncbi:alpha/beta hydrolase [Streptomyces sp. NPDC090032]|uniref:alpha/beta hydrolase n=1 Tax=Streptomyces sp. NPDC090032 TaxID=3365925 RepID=UPI00382CB270